MGWSDCTHALSGLHFCCLYTTKSDFLTMWHMCLKSILTQASFLWEQRDQIIVVKDVKHHQKQMGQDMTKGTLWLCSSKSSWCCRCKVLSFKCIFWKFEAVIFSIDEYMEVWSNICNPVWDVTSRRTLNLYDVGVLVSSCLLFFFDSVLTSNKYNVLTSVIYVIK